MFVQVRDQALQALTTSIYEIAPSLSREQVQQLATYAIAGADGLFIAKEIGGDSVDLLPLFTMHGQALYDTAVRMITDNSSQSP